MKTISTLFAISLFFWFPNANNNEVTLEEIPLNIENFQYTEELENAGENTLYLEEIELNLENTDYMNELDQVDFFINSSVQLEEIPFHLVYNEIEKEYELEDRYLIEIPLVL